MNLKPWGGNASVYHNYEVVRFADAVVDLIQQMFTF